MNHYFTIIPYLIFAEVVRRCILTVKSAFTGPLAKIPGPFLAKFTRLPRLFETLSGNHMNSTTALFEKFGDVVRVAPRTVLVASKAGINKVLIEDDFVKAPYFDGMRLHPGNAMLVTERDKVTHKRVRRLLSPGFSISYLNGLEPLVQECVQELESVLDAMCKRGNGSAVVDMQGTLGNMAFDAMSATFLGGSFHMLTSDDTSFKKTFSSIMLKVAIHAQLPFLKHVPFVPKPISAHTDDLLDGVLNRRENQGRPVRKDIVQIILDAHAADPIGFPEARMRDEIALFMVAGSETTGLMMTVILEVLVKNPEKLKFLVEEIDSTFSSGEITFAKLQDLPYLNAVIWEGMRVKGAPAGLIRYTTETTVIGGFEIPAETTVQPWPISVMRNPQIWPDAGSFIPERWLGPYKEAEADRKNIFTFSAGPRNCIGWQYAMREMRLTLATLVHRYELSLVKEQSDERRYFLAPSYKQGFYNVKIKLRR